MKEGKEGKRRTGEKEIQKERKVRKIFIIFGLVLMFVFILVALGFARDGSLEIQIEPMWMDVYGYDEHVGDIFYYKEKWNAYTSTLEYGITYEPINLNMKDGLALRAELTYRKNQWGWGLSGWQFNTDASETGRVTTPLWQETSTGYIYYENGVRMWDHTIWPLWNDLEESLCSPVDYFAENKLGIWTADVFGIRTLAEKPASQIDFVFGAKLGSLNNERREGQEQRAYVYYDPEYFSELPYWPEGYDWDNYVTLESKSKANYEIMLGPVLGFQGQAKYKRWGIEGFINQSVLFGNVKYEGIWEDIDDIWYAEDGDPVGSYLILYGSFPFAKEEKTAVPVTELKLKVLYDITDNISLSFGSFLSIWWDAPVAPEFSLPGNWEAGGGTGWQLQKRTLEFKGLVVDLKIRL